MACLSRVGGLLAALVLALSVATPTLALESSWREPARVPLDAMLAELVPLHQEVAALNDELPMALRGLNSAVSDLRLADIVTQTEVVREGFDRLAAVAKSGIAVLDRYGPERCYWDYWAVERVAFISLGDAAAYPPAGGLAYNRGMQLILIEADLILQMTEC